MADTKEPPKHAAQKAAKAENKMRALTAEEQSELDHLNEIMANLQHTIRPAPYIISTPSLEPYQHRDRESARSFMMGKLWGTDEAHLQYRTFKYREPYGDIFVMQTGEDVDPEPEWPQSQASNAERQGPKKKMTLSAYKEKKKGGGAVAAAFEKPSPSLAPTKAAVDQPKAVKHTGESASSKAQKAQNGAPAKRPAPEDILPERAEKRRREQNEERVRQPKQPAQPKKTDVSDVKKSPDQSVASNASPHGLPPMLSPIGESLQNPHNLPPILSPTLPPNIQAELDRLEIQRKRTDSNASTSSSDRKSQNLNVPDTDVPKRSEPPKVESKLHTAKTEKSPNSPLPKPVEPPSAPTLMVKLKIGKHIKKRAADLLRLPPKPCAAVVAEKKEREHGLAKDRTEPEKPRQKTTDAAPAKAKDVPKIVARNVDTPAPRTKAPSTTLKLAEKRPRVDDDASLAVPSKRPRASTLERPSTPAQQATTSPSLSNKSSTQKNGIYTTPRKDLKSISMSRMNSAEGFDSTPGRSGATPAGKLPNGKLAPTSAPINGKVQADIHALSQASMKLNALGRSLKHEVQKIMKESGDRPSRKDAERAAITSVECILSYMTAYQVQDRSTSLRGRPLDVENTWVTLLPLCMSYTGRTKDFAHLDGLRLHLCSVISSTICSHVSNRARAYSPKDAPTAEMAANLKLLADHFKLLTRSSMDATVALSYEDIMSNYPKTYRAREADVHLAKETETFSANDLSGPYFLPIGSETTPLQAVRFGLRLLREHVESQKLDYTLRVNLDKAD
ncbi:hypothetical protein P154DRAFT_520444 [Amniculicola lignicola CBS 123094]|uniref:Uncharacterized protein n=1 Tax=Amniculicola lignicola CBS 123094 TaxID=1392246 RepID=A0A6A5WPW8_9PLEO|nr:hypothetical protein P154DRAFT_520444 [Amniculicola lignicola CBS 123094]